MKTVFYKIECLTNMHVGASEVNYDIVDNDVERDSITGVPIIHASGVKGALRDALAKNYSEEEINTIFGARGSSEMGNGGTHKFLDAMMISRPMRIYGSQTLPSVSVFTVGSVNSELKRISDFGCDGFGINELPKIDFGKNKFLTSLTGDVRIEAEKTGFFSDAEKNTLGKISAIIGKEYAVAQSFDDYELPVVARNCLDGKGNLWYERIVPHGSVFVFGVIYPDGAEELAFPKVVQFGGNASVGCGYTTITKIAE